MPQHGMSSVSWEGVLRTYSPKLMDVMRDFYKEMLSSFSETNPEPPIVFTGCVDGSCNEQYYDVSIKLSPNPNQTLLANLSLLTSDNEYVFSVSFLDCNTHSIITDYTVKTGSTITDRMNNAVEILNTKLMADISEYVYPNQGKVYA